MRVKRLITYASAKPLHEEPWDPGASVGGTVLDIIMQIGWYTKSNTGMLIGCFRVIWIKGICVSYLYQTSLSLVFRVGGLWIVRMICSKSLKAAGGRSQIYIPGVALLIWPPRLAHFPGYKINEIRHYIWSICLSLTTYSKENIHTFYLIRLVIRLATWICPYKSVALTNILSTLFVRASSPVSFSNR